MAREIAINGAAARRRRPNFVSLTVQRVSSGRDSHSLIVGRRLRPCGGDGDAAAEVNAREAREARQSTSSAASVDSCRREASFPRPQFRMYHVVLLLQGMLRTKEQAAWQPFIR